MSTAPDRWAWSPLGQMLVNDKLLSTEQLNQALERQRKTRERLGQILIDMKLIDEDILLKYLGAQFRKDPITRQDLAALDPDVVKLVSEEVARQYGVIAAERSGRRLIVATADPLNVMAMDDLRRATGLEVDFRIGPASAIQEAIEKTYRKVTQVVTSEGLDDALKVDLGLNVGPVASAAEGVVDIKQLQTQADDPPVVRVVNYLLGRAALDGASDIHVEPHDDRTTVSSSISSRSRASSTSPWSPASRSFPGSTSPSGACPRTGASPLASTVRSSTSASPPSPPSMARRSCSGSSRKRRWWSATASRTSASSRSSSRCS